MLRGKFASPTLKQTSPYAEQIQRKRIIETAKTNKMPKMLLQFFKSEKPLNA